MAKTNKSWWPRGWWYLESMTIWFWFGRPWKEWDWKPWKGWSIKPRRVRALERWSVTFYWLALSVDLRFERRLG